jgi:hypothetical protein
MLVQHVVSLSKNICLCSYVLVSFLQLESDDNGSVPQSSAWFPILDRATVQCQYSKKGSVFVQLTAGSTEPSPLGPCL